MAALGNSGRALVNQGVGHDSINEILRCEKGANAIEYALVASLISIAALAAFHQLGDAIDTMYGNVSNKM